MEDWPRLRPTRDQYQNFADYLCEAHSWYKHLPLMGGQQFAVFLAPNAGIGRLVALLHGDSQETATGYSLVTPKEGSEFTEAKPRGHYGWKTTKEYRTRFGHLDYSCCQDSDGAYARDAGPSVRLSAPPVERCEFVLYPYVSGEFAEAVIWNIHAEALAELRCGASHPKREEILELARLAEALVPAWDALSEPESDWVLTRHDEGAKSWPSEQSDALRSYLRIDDGVNAIAESLRDREADKIRRALTELDDWLALGQASEA